MPADAALDPTIRERIMADPEALLEDRDLMRVLAEANSRQAGENVVDIRGVAIERLEARLDRLEDTHRSVIAAAYENLAGTNQIHRAVLALLEPVVFEEFLAVLGGEVAQILRADAVRLVLETMQDKNDPAVARLSDVLSVSEPGFVDRYMGNAAEGHSVELRQTRGRDDRLFGDRAAWLRSEACIRLDLGRRRLPGMLVIASEDPHMFKANQGTDLLAFFGGVFERSMRRWLA
jgi:hypothetical protein